MKLPFTEADLIKSRNNEDIVRQTAKQIIKDFALFGLTIEFPSDIKYAYHELFSQLENQIFYLLETNNTKILSLLYQIDIPEKMIQKKATALPNQSLSEVITELVLVRELKKVLTRLYFKDQGIS
jgi:hypothetical protein